MNLLRSKFEKISSLFQGLSSIRKLILFSSTFLVVALILFKGYQQIYSPSNQYKNSEPIISTSSSPSPTPNYKEEASANCNSSEYYIKFLQDGFGSSVKLQRGDPFMVNWKRNSSEPYIFYPAEREVEITIYQEATDVNKIYKTSVDNKFRSIGFVADPPNTISYTLTPNYPVYRYGYRNGNSLIVVNISGHFSSSLTCGVVDPKYDVLYTELLSSLIIADDLKTSSNENGLQDMFFGIWEIHQNNIVYTNIGSIGGGHAVWVQKVNNEWKLLYKGQQRPSCSLLESAGIEQGVDCLDPSSKGLYRKTR